MIKHLKLKISTKVKRYKMQINKNDVIRIRRIRNKIIIMAYFDDVPANTFLGGITETVFIIKVNKNIPRNEVIYKLKEYIGTNINS